jgi:hypothetical protein
MLLWDLRRVLELGPTWSRVLRWSKCGLATGELSSRSAAPGACSAASGSASPAGWTGPGCAAAAAGAAAAAAAAAGAAGLSPPAMGGVTGAQEAPSSPNASARRAWGPGACAWSSAAASSERGAAAGEPRPSRCTRATRWPGVWNAASGFQGLPPGPVPELGPALGTLMLSGLPQLLPSDCSASSAARVLRASWLPPRRDASPPGRAAGLVLASARPELRGEPQ